jgi:hypothetical protein
MAENAQAITDDKDALNSASAAPEEPTQATPEPADPREEEYARLERELLAECSTSDPADPEQATDPSTPAEKTEESTPSGTESDQSKTEDGKDEPGEFDFATAFPAGLEFVVKDGDAERVVRVETAEDLIARIEASERKEAADRLKWDQSLHDRGRKLNEERAALLAEKARIDAERAELEQFRREKAERASQSAIPALPPKPSLDLLDPSSDVYNPAEYRRLDAAYEAAREARTQKQIEASIRRASEPKAEDPAQATYDACQKAEQDWYAAQADLSDDAKREITERSVHVFSDMLAEINDANAKRPPGAPMDTLRPRDVRATLELLRRDYVAERAAKTNANAPTASTAGAKAAVLSIRRAKAAPQPTRQSAPAKSELDWLDDSVSPEDFDKALKAGKAKL